MAAYLTQTQEKALRAEVVDLIETIGDLAGNVYDRRRSFNSRTDFIDRNKSAVSDKFEIRFIEVSLVNVEDSPTEGFADCPVPILTYNLHLFHEFADERTDGTNSDDDFSALILALRAKFLQKLKFDNGRVECDGIVFDEFTQIGQDTFTDIRGHYKDATLRMFYYDEADD